MTSNPVASGRVTSERSTIAGAGRSTGKNRGISSGSPPSSGTPSGSTTRPSKASPGGNARNFASASHGTARRDSARFAEKHAANLSFAKIDGKTTHSAFENQQLVQARVRQAPDRRHAVANLDHLAYRLQLRFQGQRFNSPVALAEPIVKIVSERWHERRLPSARPQAHFARKGAGWPLGNAVPPPR